MANEIKIGLAEIHSRLVNVEDHYASLAPLVNQLANEEIKRPAMEREDHIRCFSLEVAAKVFAHSGEGADFNEVLKNVDYYARNGFVASDTASEEGPLHGPTEGVG